MTTTNLLNYPRARKLQSLIISVLIRVVVVISLPYLFEPSGNLPLDCMVCPSDISLVGTVNSWTCFRSYLTYETREDFLQVLS